MSDTETIERPKKKTSAPAPMDNRLRVTVERQALLRALGAVAAVVEKRNTIPVLANVLIETDGDEAVILTGTDLDLQVRLSVKAMVAKPGATTVRVDTLHAIIREVPEGSQVDLIEEDGRLTVTAARSRYRLATLPSSDFPIIDSGELPTSFVLPATTLRQMLAMVAHAQSTEETRYYLNGVCLDLLDGKLDATALDGKIMATVAIPAPEGAAGMAQVIVPRKAVAQLMRLLADEEGGSEVNLDLSDTKLRFAFGAVVLTTKAIDGDFVNWRRLIDQDRPRLLRVDKESLLRGIRRVAVVESGRTRKLGFHMEKDRLVLTAEDHATGTAREEVPADWNDEADVTGFAAIYLADTLAAIPGGEIEIHVPDRERLAQLANITLTDPGTPGAIWFVTPMRV